MTSELEKLAKSLAELEVRQTDEHLKITGLSLRTVDSDRAFRIGYERGVLAGAKAVLEFAKKHSYLEADPFSSQDYSSVFIHDLQKFIEGEK